VAPENRHTPLSLHHHMLKPCLPIQKKTDKAYCSQSFLFIFVYFQILV
jgi:hypothetical protein